MATYLGFHLFGCVVWCLQHQVVWDVWELSGWIIKKKKKNLQSQENVGAPKVLLAWATPSLATLALSIVMLSGLMASSNNEICVIWNTIFTFDVELVVKEMGQELPDMINMHVKGGESRSEYHLCRLSKICPVCLLAHEKGTETSRGHKIACIKLSST